MPFGHGGLFFTSVPFFHPMEALGTICTHAQLIVVAFYCNAIVSHESICPWYSFGKEPNCYVEKIKLVFTTYVVSMFLMLSVECFRV